MIVHTHNGCRRVYYPDNGDVSITYWAVLPRAAFPDAPSPELQAEVQAYAECQGLVSRPRSQGPGMFFVHPAGVRFGRTRILLKQSAGYDI